MVTSRTGGFVAIGLAGLVAGYFIGREHIKYEIRSKLQTAAVQFKQDVSSYQSAKTPDVSSKKSEVELPLEHKKDDVINAKLMNKGFHQKNVQEGDYQEYLTFQISFENKTNKNIRAFDGVLMFNDLLDNTIISANIAINEPILAGARLEWEGQIEYNQFMQRHQNLRSEDQSNLKVVFRPRKILYTDGSTQIISER